MYKHPGVYIEELPSGVIPIEAASTSVAAFIGSVRRGPINKPRFITGVIQFEKDFGEMNDPAGGIRDFGDKPDYFGHAVHAFFGNGGKKAYIVRVAKDGVAAEAALIDPEDSAVSAFYFTASSEGIWANNLWVKLAPEDPTVLELGYNLEIGTGAGADFEALETFSGVSLNPADGTYLGSVVNNGSALVNVERKPILGAGSGGKTKALRGDSLADEPFPVLTGEKLKIAVDGLPEVEITFLASHDTIEKVATFIQTEVQDAVDSTNPEPGLEFFKVLVTNDKSLLLISGSRGTTSKVLAPGTAANVLARASLKLNSTAADTIEYPATGKSQMMLGEDGDLQLGPTDYNKAFTVLKDYRDVSIILLPGVSYNVDGKGIIDAAITHSETMKNRVVVVDPPEDSTFISPKSVKVARLPTSSHAALYYPWLKVPNPHFHPEIAANLPSTFLVGASAFAAGIWARIDGTRGVWKAPAGLEASVRGSLGPSKVIGDDIQDNLNDLGINCIRSIIGPPVVWGARMLSTKVQPDFRYVPIRRTSAMIGESLYNALQAVVFEPNKHILWSALRSNIGNFMDGLFRAGAFQGEKASDAYFVRCNLGDTMTQADVDAGIVRVIVGYAALKPAEFVIIQLKQKVGQSTS